ncbi:ribbon-helix-helix protein, CopG family [Nostoc sp. PA-18-2419]|uniref:ribbon-helix-helix protein, CopG family n=1 Tax=Nostoc sp. PA-18-2419 TaxID=2575443 RepID=UPI001108E32A|nr:ribbon-helix-helix protein, CopG family [Nostoc sp. PA-18-2419]
MAKVNQSRQVGIRMEQGTYDWLLELSERSGVSVSELIREIIKQQQMAEGTRKVYGECLEYLASLESSEFITGLEVLIDTFREAQGNV